ncbi:MAG: response regulator transcription factor [Cyanobacteriota bacterium]|nr:response regulator transcription factor [Cyanobacteriota bacterium]
MTTLPGELPLDRDPLEKRPLKRRPAKKLRAGGATRNVWILDDDEAMCALLLEQFQKIGWSLQVFHRPLPLFEALQERQPDLLILDLLLPDKHGIDVLSRIRQIHKGFPILILSALATPGDRVVGLEAGADDYLIKPFQFRELQLRSERLLRLHRRTTDVAVLAPPSPEATHPLQEARYQLGPLQFEVADQPQLLTSDGGCHRLGRGDAALLLAFCRHPHQVLSRAQLLQASGSLVSPGQTRTIDVRLSRLRRLLRNLTGTDLILPERGQGYKLNVEVRPLGDVVQSVPRP